MTTKGFSIAKFKKNSSDDNATTKISISIPDWVDYKTNHNVVAIIEETIKEYKRISYAIIETEIKPVPGPYRFLAKCPDTRIFFYKILYPQPAESVPVTAKREKQQPAPQKQPLAHNGPNHGVVCQPLAPASSSP